MSDNMCECIGYCMCKEVPKINGIYTALITPFNDNNEIDVIAFKKMCEKQIAAGVNGIVIGGTTGESPTLEFDELNQLIVACKSVMKDMKTYKHIIIGIGTNNTKTTVGNCKAIINNLEEGFYLSGMLVLPYYNKPNYKGLVGHVLECAKVLYHMGIRVMIYHVPGRTSLNLKAEELAQLCIDVNTIYPKFINSIKNAYDKVDYFKTLYIALKNQEINIMSGDDGNFLEMCKIMINDMPICVGVVSVVSNMIPDIVVKLSQLSDYKHNENYDKFCDFVKYAFCITNPLPTKYYMSRMNMCKPICRLPLLLDGFTCGILESNIPK